MDSYIKQGDCLELMKEIPDGSVDLVLCDLPYGVTACKWDEVIPFEKLWPEYERVCKSNGAIALFGTEPFASKCRMSNQKMYKYDWIWNKKTVTNFANAKKQPLRCIEMICVFSKKQTTYNPQNLKSYNKKIKNSKGVGGAIIQGDVDAAAGKGKLRTEGYEYIQQYTNYPTQLLEFAKDKDRYHPTQKPVALLEYLIKTYTNEGETVLDNCMGSGSTCVAAVNTNRKYIGFELDLKYFETAKQRIAEAEENMKDIQQ